MTEMTEQKIRRPRPPKLDPACAEAVDLAREAALDAASVTQTVGDHLGVIAEGDRVVTHYFASTHPGYRGWRWAVTVVRASRAKKVTVDEVVLIPGDDSLLAPDWVPWADRIEPGDVAPGILMPTADDDPRLEPGYTAGEYAADLEPAEPPPCAPSSPNWASAASACCRPSGAMRPLSAGSTPMAGPTTT